MVATRIVFIVAAEITRLRDRYEMRLIETIPGELYINSLLCRSYEKHPKDLLQEDTENIYAKHPLIVLVQLLLVLQGSLVAHVAGKSSKSSASLSPADNRASVEPLRDRTSRDTAGCLEIDGNRANALQRFALFAWR
ncbi:hypothetical protein WN48_04656 [Eufriesea mexicana]|uniref:Uncharacterized protein n=1 Tax=Eufriesea mexicana TaxID=516756 RepID=A0A310SG42_9HYME|nr:hypothetical protein WN48_04656 [Eufriesea mexicana]